MVSQQNCQRKGLKSCKPYWVIHNNNLLTRISRKYGRFLYYSLLMGGNLSCDISAIHPEIISHHIHIHQCHKFLQNHHGISGISIIIIFPHKLLRSNLQTSPQTCFFPFSSVSGNEFPPFSSRCCFFRPPEVDREVRSTNTIGPSKGCCINIHQRNSEPKKKAGSWQPSDLNDL